MVSLTEEAEKLIEAYDIFVRAHEYIMEYCREDSGCGDCPIRSLCETGWLDHDGAYDSMEMWADFVERARKIDEEPEEEWFDRACTWAGLPHRILDIRKGSR